jgi:hypothetical protein
LRHSFLFHLLADGTVGDGILLFSHFPHGSEDPGTRIREAVDCQFTFFALFHLTIAFSCFCPYLPASLDIRSIYSSHSMGRRYFLRLLHSLHAGTVLPRVDFPPRVSATIWSMVNSTGGAFL